MGYLFSIETLRVNNNGFVGELPSQFKNCRDLTLFNLAENKLSGSIPECLTALVRKGSSSQTIRHDYMGDSARITFYEVYDDEASLIWKGLRAEFKSNLGHLKTIDLSCNKLIGESPSEITYLLGLISLNLSRNQLTGQIPSTIGNLQELESLDLSRNQINGRIPTSLSRIASLGTQLQSFDYAYGGNPLLCGAPLPKTCSEEEKGPGQPVLVNQDSQDGLITQGYYISMGLGQGKEAGNHADWEDLDELARGSIEQHLTDEVLCNAMKDIAKQTWEKLEEMFAAKSLSNKLFLKKEFHSLKMEEGKSMMEHVSAFNRCIADL
ncbi:probable inactive leucine-rich repeat receptor kinase XIAO [Prunus persica]|uniref:probable inactive leucine-rich repeat receptor kinase XIAO n=1 Tax=Prunus persica TaxID=3760 RepID=UPI0009AB5726|nr:probable inactive leucine-rich repeat receptor kinase XIAO [Prunus persica]